MSLSLIVCPLEISQIECSSQTPLEWSSNILLDVQKISDIFDVWSAYPYNKMTEKICRNPSQENYTCKIR